MRHFDLCVACEIAPWVPGMLTTEGLRVLRVDGERLLVAGVDHIKWVDATCVEPDLDDPSIGLLIPTEAVKKKVFAFLSHRARFRKVVVALPELTQKWEKDRNGIYMTDKDGCWPHILQLCVHDDRVVSWHIYIPGFMGVGAHPYPSGSVSFDYGEEAGAIEKAKTEVLQAWGEYCQFRKGALT